MAKDKHIIIDEIINHLVNGCGAGKYNEYYVGITKDIEARLHGDHKVPKTGHCFIYRQAHNDTDSRAIEKHFLDKGMQGGGGGGDEKSVYVYAYKITHITFESLT